MAASSLLTMAVTANGAQSYDTPPFGKRKIVPIKPLNFRPSPVQLSEGSFSIFRSLIQTPLYSSSSSPRLRVSILLIILHFLFIFLQRKNYYYYYYHHHHHHFCCYCYCLFSQDDEIRRFLNYILMQELIYLTTIILCCNL